MSKFYIDCKNRSHKIVRTNKRKSRAIIYIFALLVSFKSYYRFLTLTIIITHSIMKYTTVNNKCVCVSVCERIYYFIVYTLFSCRKIIISNKFESLSSFKCEFYYRVFVTRNWELSLLNIFLFCICALYMESISLVMIVEDRKLMLRKIASLGDFLQNNIAWEKMVRQSHAISSNFITFRDRRYFLLLVQFPQYILSHCIVEETIYLFYMW